MQEAYFTKCKQCIVDNNVIGLKQIIKDGFNIDYISKKEHYSVADYFLMFSQNFEKKEIAELIYNNSQTRIPSMGLLMFAFITSDISILLRIRNVYAPKKQEIKTVLNKQEILKFLDLYNNSFLKEFLQLLELNYFSDLELLELSIRMQNLLLTKFILANTTNLANQTINIREDRLIHTASGIGDTELIELLYASHADINIKNSFGWAPIHFATKYNHIAAVKILLKMKVNTKLTTNSQDTALEIAQKNQLEEITQILSQ